MKRSGTTVSYTSEEIREMIAGGEDLSDWARANAMTDAEIAAAIASDPDEAGIVWDDSTISATPPKAAISIRLDPDILAFFKERGRGYQTKINAVLRSYMESHRGK